MALEEMEVEVLALVNEPAYKPLKPRQIGRRLGISLDHARDLKKLIKRLARQGKLVYAHNHLVCAPGQKPATPGEGRLTGVFRRAQAGFGFVRPTGTAPAQGRDQDIYIARGDTLDAASGDRVLVRMLKSRNAEESTRGAIVEVLERETHQFVGSYLETAAGAFVQVDGTLFAHPISVGDPGAKNAAPGDKVVFEMVRFPSQVHEGEGVLTEVLGPRGQPGVDTLSIIREFDLPGEFPEDVQHAARLQAEQFDEHDLTDRDDLSAETVITIDPVDARDFDDAISLERMENGHWRLGVHIADVSHFIQPHTPLDREAYQRGTSVYLPDRVIPMLPEIISNGLASLQPDRIRYTQTAWLEFTADGVHVSTELARTAILSKRRFTYEEIDDYLAHPTAWKKKLNAQVHALVGRMYELAMILRTRRMRRGALELTMQEVKVDLDRDGRVQGAHRVENTVSHQIIEEFMLAANEAVAQRLHEAGWYFLRRVHEAPDPRKLKLLTQFVAELGFVTGGLESRFELQRLLASAMGRPQQQAVNYALLRSLQRAAYSPAQEGHYALASDCYCHFTSPIRRYPDLTIHRLVELLLLGKKSKNSFGELAVLGEHCSERERRAEQAERELTKVKLLEYLSQRIGEELDAVITGVESFGLFAQGSALPAEGLIHISSLADDNYRYDKSSHSLCGHRQGNSFRLGDPIRVQVARVDVERRELDFRLVRRSPQPAQPRAARPSKKATLKARRPVKKRSRRRE